MLTNSALEITSLYAVLLTALFIPFTLRVGAYRQKNRIFLGDGNDPELLRRIRGQGNFVETALLGLILIGLLEAGGASSIWLHSLGALLIIARLSHYLNITGLVKPLALRVFGMLGTFAVYIAASIWLLTNVIT